MRLEGKVAVVTGAASGMGRAIATRYALEGAKVVLGDRNADRLDAVVSELTGKGAEVVGVVGDIGNEDDATALVAAAVDAFGRLDVLVNNAGIMDHMAGTGEVDTAMWRKVLAVNLDGPMFTSRQALASMLAQGSGSIVNIASTAALSGGAAGTAYTTSKHGLLGLTRSTAWMYAQRGVRCNAICPGATATNIQESMPAEQLDPVGAARAGQFGALIPAVLEADDIADLALFLASDESARINGAVITADGGWMAL